MSPYDLYIPIPLYGCHHGFMSYDTCHLWILSSTTMFETFLMYTDKCMNKQMNKRIKKQTNKQTNERMSDFLGFQKWIWMKEW